MFHILLAVLGICLVIFVHELGHFIAARLAGVRVETFSIGMGPPIFSWKRGDTRYQIAVLPLGGYVKMAGEELAVDEDSDENTPKRVPKSDELQAKSVGARFFIFAGGVIMNVIFALIVFPLVFFAGVPFTAPVIGLSQPGSPAWNAGLKSGTEIVAVNGEDVFAFSHIPTAIALSPAGPVELEIREPGAVQAHTISIVPENQEELGVRMIGISPAFDEDMHLGVTSESVAAQAGVLEGDMLRAVEGSLAGVGLANSLRLAAADGGIVRIQIETEGVPGSLRWVDLDADETESDRRTIGIEPMRRMIAAVRPGSAAELAGFKTGDRLLGINGTPLLNTMDLRRALLSRLGLPSEVNLERAENPMQLSVDAMDESNVVDFMGGLAIALDSGSSAVIVAPDGSAYRAGLRTGDRIVRIDGVSVAGWDDIPPAIRIKAALENPISVKLEVMHQSERGAALEARTFNVLPEQRPLGGDLGLAFRYRQVDYKADSLGAAFTAGATSTLRALNDSWRFLKGVLTSEVSGKNAGGIITIGMVSTHWASEGLAKLFFFLAILSMNLAFLNILPIPMLDGGHLFFLIIEKLKGSPVSIKIQMMSQAFGVVMLLSLMLYVTYNDVMRWFFQ